MSQSIEIIPQDITNFTFKYFFENIKNVKEFYVYGNISQYDSLLNLSSINVHFNDGGDCSIIRNDYGCHHWYSAFDYLNDDNVFNIKNIDKIAKQWENLNFVRFAIGSNDSIPLHLDGNFLKLTTCVCQCVKGYIGVIDDIHNIPAGLYDLEKWIELKDKLLINKI